MSDIDIEELRFWLLQDTLAGTRRDGLMPISNPDRLTAGTLRAIIDELAALRSAQQWRGIESEGVSFQRRVEPWFRDCFPPHVCDDRLERCDRFIEEAIELVQAAGYSAERAHALVDYTFNRPQDEINQEVGGVMVTLAALCIAHGIDMHQGGETELARISQPEVIAKIRAKQASKPTGSALPVASTGADQ